MGNVALNYAGLEIAMAPGFKTYWRNPGEAGGIPPEFDFSGSGNLQSASVLYPVPHRTRDKAGENIAYKDHVILPVLLEPQDKSQPIALKVKAVYGVCKDICIPAEAELSTTIPEDAAQSAALQHALGTVPVLAPDPMREVPGGSVHDPRAIIDPAKDPVLTAWRIERGGGKARLVLEVKDAAGAGTDAFLYSADGLYMPMTSPVPGAVGTVFAAELTEGASLKDLAGKTVSVTLAGTAGQSETFIQLPKDLATP